MNRKDLLQKVVNFSLKPQLNKMFGDGSNISVSNISYVRSKKCNLINVTLFITDVENGYELFPDGLEMLINQGWKVVGDGLPIIVQSSLDLK
jgi:hypothetical protein